MNPVVILIFEGKIVINVAVKVEITLEGRFSAWLKSKM